MKKRILAICIIVSMLICLFSNSNISTAEEQKNIFGYKGENFEVEFQLEESWQGGYRASITLKNITSKKLKNWGLSFELEDDITSIWNAEIQTKQENYYTIKNAGWNQTIQPNGNATFSFVATGEFLYAPEGYRLLSSKKIVDNPDYAVEYTVSDCWNDGFNGSLQIRNQSDKTIYGWSLEFEYAHEIENIWNAEIVGHTQEVYQIDSMEYNQNIMSGQCVTFGFTCLDNNSGVNLKNIQLYQYVFEEGGSQEVLATESPKENIVNTTGSGIITEDNAGNIAEDMEQKEESEGKEEEEIQQEENIEQEKTEGEKEETSDQNSEDNREKNDEVIEGSDPSMAEEEEIPKIATDNATDYVYIEYISGNTEKSVTDNVIFVNDAKEQMEVIWKSSNQKVIENDGVVHRQEHDEMVTITAEIKVGQEVVIKKFELTVIAQKQWKLSDIEDLNIQQIKEMNKDNEEYDCKVNDFGYIQYVYGKYSPVKVDSYESALYSLYSIKTALGITDPFKELQPYDVDVTESKYIFKFHQVYGGLEVFSNNITISSDLNGNICTLYSNYYPFQQELNITPYYNYEQAAELLQKKFGEIVISEEEKENKLCIINYYGHIDLVWNFLIESEDASSSLGNEEYRVMIGAKDGEIKYKNQVSMSARTWSIETSGIDMLGENRTFNSKKKMGIFTTYYLEDITRKLKVQRKKLLNYRTISDTKNNEWIAEDISAMANVKRVYDFYHSMFNRLSVNDAKTKSKGKTIKIRFSGDEDNLWWKNNKIVIGVGTGKDKKGMGYCLKKEELAAAKDLLCHEFTHGVVANETDLDDSNYGYTASINESYADTAACFLDGNWTIGEEAVGVINNKQNPVRDNKIPENVNCPSEYGGKYFVDIAKLTEDEDEDKGATHINCTILTHAVYLMQEAGIKKRDLMKIWYESLLLGYGRDANFYHVRKNFVSAWKELKEMDDEKAESSKFFSGISEKKYLDIINDAFDKVKVTEGNCNLDYIESNYFTDRGQYADCYFDDDISLQGKICVADKDGRLGNNKALADAELFVLDVNNMELLDETISDENGRYELNPDYREEYILEIQKEGYLSERMYIHNVNPIIQKEYYCDIVELMPKSYEGYGRADGWIFDATDKKPIEGVRLKWRKGINNYDSEVVEDTTTIECGDYYSRRLPAGNYCVEVIAEDLGYINTYFNVKVVGGTTIDYQYGYISPQIASGQIRTVLSWGEIPADIDSHMNFTLSNGMTGHVYYRNMEEKLENSLVCALDRDDITQYGPETTTIYEGMTGIYNFSVKNYSKECNMGPEGGVVRVYFGGHAYPSYTFYMPEEAINYWKVYSYNSATEHLQPSNEIS